MTRAVWQRSSPLGGRPNPERSVHLGDSDLRDKYRRVEDGHLKFPFLNFFSFESASSSPVDYRRFCELLETAVARTPDRVEVPTELVPSALRSGSGV